MKPPVDQLVDGRFRFRLDLAYDGTDFILVGPADSTTPLTAASATISGNLTVDGDASFNANLTIGDVLYVGANAPSWATSVNLTDEIAVMYLGKIVEHAKRNPTGENMYLRSDQTIESDEQKIVRVQQIFKHNYYKYPGKWFSNKNSELKNEGDTKSNISH